MYKKRFLAIGLAVCMALASTITGIAAPLTGVEAEQLLSQKQTKLSDADINLLKEMFDANFFAAKYPQIVAAIGTDADALFNYFITYGVWEGKQCNANFNVQAYAAANADLSATFTTNVMSYYRHYFETGKDENRISTIESAILAGITESQIKSYIMGLDSDNQPRFIKGTPQTAADKMLSIIGIAENGNAIAVNIEKPITNLATLIYTDIAKQLEPNSSPNLIISVTEDTDISQNDNTPSYQEFSVSGNSLIPSWEPTAAQIEAYQLAYENWAGEMPDARDYMNESELAAYNSDYNEWINRQPQRINYFDKIHYNAYPTYEAAYEAYQSDCEVWEAGIPKPEDYMAEEPKAQYQSDIADWIASKPQLDSDSFAIYDTEAFNLAHTNWQTGYDAIVQSNFKNTWFDEERFETLEDAKTAYTQSHNYWITSKELFDSINNGSVYSTGALTEDQATFITSYIELVKNYITGNCYGEFPTWDSAIMNDTGLEPLNENEISNAYRALYNDSGIAISEPQADDYYTETDDVAAYTTARQEYINNNTEPDISDYYIGQDEESYGTTVANWKILDPKLEEKLVERGYLSEEEYENYQIDVNSYNGSNARPNIDTYHYVGDGCYENEAEATAAYIADYNTWSGKKPNGINYIEDIDEKAAYNTECSEWESYRPILSEHEINNHGYDSDDRNDWDYIYTTCNLEN